MVDWLSSMQQSYEFYTVDPASWKDIKLIDTVKKCIIKRDSKAETLGSATLDATESLGECYIRVYLITNQNGVKEKHPLGTVLVQTPSSNYNGTTKNISMDAYTPLIELKENNPPIGYSIEKKNNELIMDVAARLTEEHLRAPVIGAKCDQKFLSDFVADTDDTWLSFIKDMIAPAKYELDIDEMGRVLYKPKKDIDALQPIWTFKDDNSSILYPEISMNHDLYGIPNVVEVIYSSDRQNNDSQYRYYSRVVNDDPNSPISTINRGREIVHRVTDPGFAGIPKKDQVDEYAEALLKELSSIEYTITYTHGYCPVRIGDCVLLNYSRAGIKDVKAKVISQSISCTPGCPVTETAVFTKKLWR